MAPIFTIGKAIDPGIKRRNKPNQDTIGTFTPSFFNRRPPLLVLSDGMGGYGGGEVASRITVDTFIKEYKKARIDQTGYCGALLTCISKAHAAVKKRAGEDKNLELMGCTVVAAVLTEEKIYLSDVGDSRAYLITQENMRQISYDHSLVMELVRRGMITKEEAAVHPKKNILSMSISGRRDSLDPFTDEIEWKSGDVLVLCSDGLWGPVIENSIDVVAGTLEPQAAAEKLVNMANVNQGPDNISVIIARNGEKVKFDRLGEDETDPGIQINPSPDSSDTDDPDQNNPDQNNSEGLDTGQ